MSKRDNLEKTALMLSIINQKLTNQNLHEYIFDKFECIIDNSFKVKEITDNGLKAKDKNLGDIFKITFEPNIENFSKIITSYTCWNNRHTETKEIIFDEEKITINEYESTIYIQQRKLVL